MIIVGVDVGLTSDFSAVVVASIDRPQFTVRMIDRIRPDYSTSTTVARVVQIIARLLAYRPGTGVAVAVDGVGIGAPVAEQIRERIAEAHGLALVNVGVVLATGGAKPNTLEPGPLDFRLTAPAAALIEEVAVQMRSGALVIEATAKGRDQLESDLLALETDKAGKVTAARGPDGHSDTASALAIAVHVWAVLTAPDPTEALWAKAAARDDQIRRAARNGQG